MTIGHCVTRSKCCDILQASPAASSKPVESIPTPAASSSRAAVDDDGSEDGEEDKADDSKGLRAPPPPLPSFDTFAETKVLPALLLLLILPRSRVQIWKVVTGLHAIRVRVCVLDESTPQLNLTASRAAKPEHL